MNYLDFPDRPANSVYRDLLRLILDTGELVGTQMEEPAWTVLGHQFRFQLEQGFPLITERDLALEGKRPVFHQAIGEVCAFMNGARTHGELCEFGCRWWRPWVSKEKCAKRDLLPGDLGPGSYGPAWHDFPTSEGRPFNQIQHLVEQIREKPQLRTHFLSPWIPQYCGRGQGKKQRVIVAPCHGWVHFRVLGDRLHLHHFQRSADAPVGLPANLIMYGAMLLMMAQVTGYEPGSLIYTVSDLHVYERQLKAVEEMLATEPQQLPTVTLDQDVTGIFDFRAEHFTLTDYHPQQRRFRIDTPV
jgi:thymidylate synthase